MNFNVKAIYPVLLIMVVFSAKAGAQQVIKTSQGGTIKEVLILPLSYPVDHTCKDIDAVKTGNLTKGVDAPFKAQLEKIAANAAKKGGNVLQLTRMEDHEQGGRYRLWGEAYNTKEYDRLKTGTLDKEKNKFSDGPCAYLTIYYPEYTQGFSGDMKYFITINDTLKIEMWGNAKYILKITKAGSVKLKVSKNNFTQNMNVDVKIGDSYYVRSYVNFSGSGKDITTGDFQVHVSGFTPYMEKIDETQGELESGMVTRYVVSKKI